ncbi:MAG: alanine racemase [Actinomycetota bacterium]|nr:alanine racemase [Actinomycetota bacterium]
MNWSLPEDLSTPALVVDHDALVANVARMAASMGERGVALRPHAKTHKSLAIAALQRAHGASGLTVATVGEAEVFAEDGWDDIFIAYPVIAQRDKARRLAHLGRRMHLSVGVDSVDGAALLVAAGLAGMVTAMIEIDSGQHRTGVAPEDAGDLAEAVTRRGLQVEGVFTHGGQSYRAPGAPAGAARDEVVQLGRAVEALERRDVAVVRVSAGSSPTVMGSAVPPVTEERPGTYVFNDRQQVALGAAETAQVALAVAATVVSTAVRGQVVLDAGSKSLGSDRPAWLTGFGVVPELGGAVVTTLSECHAIVDLGDHPPPRVGTMVRVVPNHVCPVVNLFDSYSVVSTGEVIDRWPVAARGHLS